MYEAAAQGSGANDTEFCDVLGDLDISAETSADKAAMDEARVWVTIEDD